MDQQKSPLLPSSNEFFLILELPKASTSQSIALSSRLLSKLKLRNAK